MPCATPSVAHGAAGRQGLDFLMENPGECLFGIPFSPLTKTINFLIHLRHIKKFITAGQGLEPRYLVPKTSVLPLDDPAINAICSSKIFLCFSSPALPDAKEW